MPDLQEFHDEFQGRVTLAVIDLGLFTGLGSQKAVKEPVDRVGRQPTLLVLPKTSA